MARAVAYVARHPGCSAFACAKATGPNGSVQYGLRFGSDVAAFGVSAVPYGFGLPA